MGGRLPSPRVPSGSDRQGGGEEAHGGKRGSHVPAPCPTCAPRALLTIVHFAAILPARILGRHSFVVRAPGRAAGARVGIERSHVEPVEREPPQQIPVVVLAGFLGSGKTTLLNHLLHRSGGSRIGAIVNDFGAIEIDAMAVAGAARDSTVSLGNGCLCCAVDASELDNYLERLARPAARIDVIVIEASGLAEPQELVRMLLASEQPADRVRRARRGRRRRRVRRHASEAPRDRPASRPRRPRRRQQGRPGGRRPRAGPRTSSRGARRPCGRRTPRPTGGSTRSCSSTARPNEERVGQLSFDDLHEHTGEDQGGDAHADHLHTAYDSLSFTSDMPHGPAPVDGVPRQPARGALPHQGVRRLRRRRPA